MVEKDKFLRIFEELGDIHNDDITVITANTVSACGNPCITARIYDTCRIDRQKLIAEFVYPLDCIGQTDASLVNKIYEVLDSHFHMDMRKKAQDIYSKGHWMRLQQLIQPEHTGEIIKSMEKALTYEPETIKNTYDRIFGASTTNMTNVGWRIKKYYHDPSYFCSFDIPKWRSYVYKIDRVIFNDPATIILWKSGEKTVVKCGPNEEFDKEKGLAMALCKYILGNKGNFNEFFKKFMEEK